VCVRRNRDGLRRTGDGPIGVLQAVSRDRAHDAKTGLQRVVRPRLQQSGDTCGRARFDEHTFGAREDAVGLEDLAVGNGLDRATGLVACGQRLLPRRWVADANRRRDRCRLRNGRTFDAWKPRIIGRWLIRPASSSSV
jgi:hypothetical protein